MKTLMQAFLVGAILLVSLFVSAQSNSENRAVNITISANAGSVDPAALQRVRKVIGSAITANAISTFYVYYPRADGPASMESGLSACAETAFNATPKKFNDLIKQLHSIRPRAGTFINVELAERCKEIEPIQPLDCGGVLGALCGGAQYCEIGAGQCKITDALGSCKAIPAVCTKEYRPVCGCDGETYGNECEAVRAEVSLDHHGRCKLPEELVRNDGRNGSTGR